MLKTKHLAIIRALHIVSNGDKTSVLGFYQPNIMFYFVFFFVKIVNGVNSKKSDVYFRI